MARDYPNSVSNKLLCTSVPMTQPPFTMAAWFKPSLLVGGGMTVFALMDSASDINYHAMSQLNSGAMSYRARSTANGTNDTASVNLVNVSQWNFCAMTSAKGSGTNVLKDIYLNGAGPGQGGVFGDYPTIAQMSIGLRSGATDTAAYQGQIAYIGLWDKVLSFQELGDLYRGADFRTIRPLALRVFRELGEAQELWSPYSFTISGALPVPHPKNLVRVPIRPL